MILSFRGIGSFFALFVLLLLMSISLTTAIVRKESKDLPSIEPVLNYKPSLYSEVISSEGEVVYYFGNEKRKLVTYEEVPSSIINAFIAAEDKNFWEHHGYDPMAILKAFYINVTDRSGKRGIGGSTITQQVVKNIILNSERTLSRKVKEALLAQLLENNLSKEKILEIYLNDIYMGYGAYGISEAAKIYFNKDISNINIPEAAFLASLPKAPSRYSVDVKLAENRRKYVLDRMLDIGYINKARYDWSLQQPLPIPLNNEIKNNVKEFVPHFINAASDELEEYIGVQNATSSGLQIQLTMNSEIQKIAEQALQSGLVDYSIRKELWRGGYSDLNALNEINEDVIKSLGWKIGKIFTSGNKYSINSNGIDYPISQSSIDWVKKSNKNLHTGWFVIFEIVNGEAELRQIPEVQGAVVVMNPKNGEILGITGAFSERLSEYNRASMAKRQPGSLLKTFIYGIALENGWNPASPILDSNVSYANSYDESKVWRPNDHNQSERGFVTLRSGLEYSRNTVTVRLFEDIGFNTFEDYISKYDLYESVPREMSVALGSKETSLLSLVSAYSSVANNGKIIEPVFIKSVKSDNFFWENPEYYSNLDLSINRVYDPVTIYQLQSMLNGVTEYGTAWKAFDNAPYTSYGKTGTSNSANDAWYIGFTENVVIGAFVGFDQPQALGKGESGGNTAAPIVRTVMDALFETHPELMETNYLLPENAKIVEINPDTGVPTQGGFEEIFRK